MVIRTILVIVAGAFILLSPWRPGTSPGERHDRRLAELEAGADERFFEEKRALRAYPPLWRGPVPRVFGALLILAGLAILYLARS